MTRHESLDTESLAWLRALDGTPSEREAAAERLHALLLRAAYFELSRGRTFVRPGDRDDLAMQAADDALASILRKLHTFRGASRFTTWAYKFVLFEAGAKARRREWQGRELPLEADGWARLCDHRATGPDSQAETAELFAAMCTAMSEVLTAHQRSVLVALTLNEVPIDVLAERRGTTRGALYKTVYDARRKLRARLAQQGLDASEIDAPTIATQRGN